MNLNIIKMKSIFMQIIDKFIQIIVKSIHINGLYLSLKSINYRILSNLLYKLVTTLSKNQNNNYTTGFYFLFQRFSKNYIGIVLILI